MTHRPAVVAFDVIETLMSLEPLRERLTEIGQPSHLLEAWYTRTLRDGMALSATGDFAPFTDVAESALRGLTGYTVSDEQVAQVMAGFSELPAFPGKNRRRDFTRNPRLVWPQGHIRPQKAREPAYVPVDLDETPSGGRCPWLIAHFTSRKTNSAMTAPATSCSSRWT